MLRIKHILFPLDFSERCCHAVPFVEAMASRLGARITLLSATDVLRYAAYGAPGGQVVVDQDQILADLDLRVQSSLTREFAHLTVDRVAKLGDPAQEIVDFARKKDVDLIMMPTHGYGPFRSLLLGSVTAKVLHDSEIPVWTAAHVDESPCAHHVACRNVLCAVDGSPESVPLMRGAFDFANDMGATLRIVHVVPGMEGVQARQMNQAFEEEFRREARTRIEGFMSSAAIRAPLCIVERNVADGVREEARRHGADLVVIGRGSIHETLGRLRTHAHGIIRRAPCPVLSV